MATTSLIDVARSAGASVVEIPRKRAWTYMQSWREVYCAPVRAATGKWVHANGHAWHTFENGFFRCVKGKTAFREYAEQNLTDLLVLPEHDHTIAVRCSAHSPIDFSALYLDVYVAPESLEWTMVFPHESPEHGPYFARSDWWQPTSFPPR